MPSARSLGREDRGRRRRCSSAWAMRESASWPSWSTRFARATASGALLRDRLAGRERRRPAAPPGPRTRGSRGRCAARSRCRSARPASTSSFAQATPTRRSSRLVPPKPGQQAEVHLGLAEARAARGVDPVAGAGELAAAAEREAVHRGDRRHRQRLEGAERLVAEAAEGLGLERASCRASRRCRRPRRRRGPRRSRTTARSARRPPRDAERVSRARRAARGSSAFSTSGRFSVSERDGPRRSSSTSSDTAASSQRANAITARAGP